MYFSKNGHFLAENFEAVSEFVLLLQYMLKNNTIN